MRSVSPNLFCLKKFYRTAIKKNIIHFAASKNHIGLYPGEAVVAHFSNILDEYGFKYAKGSIQIPYTAEVPKDLIKQIAGWAKSNIE